MISASCWLFKKKSITMHGNMNVRPSKLFYFEKQWKVRRAQYHINNVGRFQLNILKRYVITWLRMCP